jgi:hypothetical protein
MPTDVTTSSATTPSSSYQDLYHHHHNHHDAGHFSTAGAESAMGESFSTFESLHASSTAALTPFPENLSGSGFPQPPSTPSHSDSGFTTIQGTYTMFAQRDTTPTPTTTPGDTKPEFYRNEPSPTPSAGSQPDRLLQFQEAHSSPYAAATPAPAGSSYPGEYLESPEPYFQKPYPQQQQGFHSPPSTFPDQKDAVFSGFSPSMFTDPRPPFQTYQGGLFDNPAGNFVQGAMYRGDFNIHIGRQPYPRNLSLSIGNSLGPDM